MSDAARTAVAVFTRDLRVHDNPMLAAAADAERILPLFVYDDAIEASGFATEPRTRFLAEALRDLDENLRGLGGGLVLRRGKLVEQVCRVAEQVDAEQVHIAGDVSAYAKAREARLAAALDEQRRELRCHPEVHTVLAPGRITPSGSGPDKDHFAVFTPYHRRWAETAMRPLARTPKRLDMPAIETGTLPEPPGEHPLPRGGETEGRRRVQAWLRAGVHGYARDNDDLAGDRTSRLSPYLHFGCVSARELIERGEPSDGTDAFVRQVAWRDFHHQVLAARPRTSREDYRPRGDAWRNDEQALQAWREGQTGIPIVDAGMRQLLAEGWMHNRARLITGSFLTKTLYIDWRSGAEHFFRHLLDGDVANNCMNWQWVAGTGTDTRPNRVLNPLRQAERYDPLGEYVRRYVPELSDLDNPKDIHQPWRIGGGELRRRGYPPPIVDLDRARERFQQAREQQLSLDI